MENKYYYLKGLNDTRQSRVGTKERSQLIGQRKMCRWCGQQLLKEGQWSESRPKRGPSKTKDQLKVYHAGGAGQGKIVGDERGAQRSAQDGSSLEKSKRQNFPRTEGKWLCSH
jgi:hypothetical protein